MSRKMRNEPVEVIYTWLAMVIERRFRKRYAGDIEVRAALSSTGGDVFYLMVREDDNLYRKAFNAKGLNWHDGLEEVADSVMQTLVFMIGPTSKVAVEQKKLWHRIKWYPINRWNKWIENRWNWGSWRRWLKTR